MLLLGSKIKKSASNQFSNYCVETIDVIRQYYKCNITNYYTLHLGLIDSIFYLGPGTNLLNPSNFKFRKLNKNDNLTRNLENSDTVKGSVAALPPPLEARYA